MTSVITVYNISDFILVENCTFNNISNAFLGGIIIALSSNVEINITKCNF